MYVLESVLILYAVYTVYVLWLIARGTKHTRVQKFVQAIPPIVLPFFGAALVHAFLLRDARSAGEIKPSGASLVVTASAAGACFVVLAQLSQTRGAGENYFFLLALALACIHTPVLFFTIAYLRRQVWWTLAGVGILLPVLWFPFWFAWVVGAFVCFSLAIAAALFVYVEIRPRLAGRWTAFGLSLLVLLPFWLVPNDNWRRVPAALEIRLLCLTDGGVRVNRTVDRVDGLLVQARRPLLDEWIGARGLQYVEWRDQHGMWRYAKHEEAGKRLYYQQLPAEAFKAPYESKAARELLPFHVLMEEIKIQSRDGGEVLGRYRNYWYGLPEEVSDAGSSARYVGSEPLVAGFFMIAPGTCGEQHYTLSPWSIEARTINP